MPALTGIKIADFTTMLSGSVCTLLLSDMGAEVIKIEPLDGDPLRSSAGSFSAVNRGKRSIALDLKKAEGKEIALRLIAGADIMAQNARLGAMARMGLDYEAVAKVNPRIIYVSVSGLGTKGPYRARAAYDPTLQALSGQMVGQGGESKPPVYIRAPLNDEGAPALAAFGAALALAARSQTGQGQHVETSLLHSSVALQSGQFLDWPGKAHKNLGDAGLKGLSAANHLYQTSDGRWLTLFAPYEHHWITLCHVLGRADILADARFASAESRAANDGALVAELELAFQKKPAAEWVSALGAAGVPVAPVQGIDAALGDAHAVHHELLLEQEHTLFGKMRLLGVVTKFSKQPGAVVRSTPMLGQHTREVLAELGYGAEEIAQLRVQRVVSYADGGAPSSQDKPVSRSHETPTDGSTD